MSLGFKHLALNTGSCHQLPGFNLGYDASLQVKTPIFEKAEGGWLSYRVTVRSAHRVCAMPYPIRARSVVSPRIIRIIKALERDRGGPDESCTRCCDWNGHARTCQGNFRVGLNTHPRHIRSLQKLLLESEVCRDYYLKTLHQYNTEYKTVSFHMAGRYEALGARRATIALGTFPLSSLALLKSQVPFWP